MRVPSISLSAGAACNSPSKLLGGFFVGLDRAILPCGVILLCNMLLYDSYINVGTKGTLGVINLVDRLLHYLLLDHTYN